jgi:hypothetical protein
MKDAFLVIQDNSGQIHLGYVETCYSVTMCGGLVDGKESKLLNTLGASDVFGSITCPACLKTYHLVFGDDQPRNCRSSVNDRLNQINEHPFFFSEPNERYALSIARDHAVSAQYLRKSKSRGRQ